MARRPQSLRQQWVSYLFAPHRFFRNLLILLVVLIVLFPEPAMIALSNALIVFVGAVGPLAGPLLGIAIAVYAIWHVILRPVRSKKKKRSDD